MQAVSSRWSAERVIRCCLCHSNRVQHNMKKTMKNILCFSYNAGLTTNMLHGVGQPNQKTFSIGQAPTRVKLSVQKIVNGGNHTKIGKTDCQRTMGAFDISQWIGCIEVKGFDVFSLHHVEGNDTAPLLNILVVLHLNARLICNSRNKSIVTECKWES